MSEYELEVLRNLKETDLQYMITKEDLNKIKFDKNLIEKFIKNLDEKN